ncbi:MAG: type II toxin-antitoxin system HicB family antitoxin [Acidobacteria bacterium]|nr:type II toxin-antitoxin system HicB family antitoxin [Acidobacteriota bacterium]
MKLEIVLEPSADGGFTALVPSLPGCISEGETRAEAFEKIREAIALYLEPVQDDGGVKTLRRATKAQEHRIR